MANCRTLEESEDPKGAVASTEADAKKIEARNKRMKGKLCKIADDLFSRYGNCCVRVVDSDSTEKVNDMKKIITKIGLFSISLANVDDEMSISVCVNKVNDKQGVFVFTLKYVKSDEKVVRFEATAEDSQPEEAALTTIYEGNGATSYILDILKRVFSESELLTKIRESEERLAKIRTDRKLQEQKSALAQTMKALVSQSTV